MAQPGLKVTQVTASGPVSSLYDPDTGASAKAPVLGKYWDGLASTDYYNVPPYVAAPPNPQIAVGPDDVLTIVNRTIARYPNPNAAGNTGPSNPYNNPPTEKSWLDVWLGITNLASLCPSGTGSNAVCVIDNPTIRYDQLQGRFVVLFTVTDMPAHRSNWVLIVSKFSQFTKCTTTSATCPSSSPLFTPPVIAPVVGGTSTGGVNSANWVMSIIPINLAFTPAASGSTAPGTVSTANTIPGTTQQFLTTPFCANGGPASPFSLSPRTCTDYFPTAARIGLDNDNIILVSPVLDMSLVTGITEGTLPTVPGTGLGPYAGTRVTTVPKLVVYNGNTLGLTQPYGTTGCSPTGSGSACGAVNLADNIPTGTLTACGLPGTPTPLTAACGVAPAATANPIAPILWEPNNLRGRALASYDAQVGPLGSNAPGVITPLDYLVGTRVTDLLTNGYVLGDPILYVQPVVFTCPGAAIFSGPSGVTFCGTAGGGANGQIPDLPVLGTVRTSATSIANTGDPAPVGQDAAFDTTTMASKRLFVGDSRPQQVMFREGLLYIARAVRLYDSTPTALGTSTVMYDVLRAPNCAAQPTQLTVAMTTTSTSATVANSSGFLVGNTIRIDAEEMTITGVNQNVLTVTRKVNGTSAATHDVGAAVASISPCPFSISGSTLPNPALVLETQWVNGQNVPDPTGNAGGYGFYGPMFDSPANVISSGPTSPINLFPWLEKLFVGMTTGGTANLQNTFSKHWPSLWDFRPADDAYDTVQPYLDPVTGIVFTSVTPCIAGTTTTCPMIPFGTRGGASTDPNDGSLWLYGEFAKSRLSTIPGPGQWGTAVANYALDFPAVDPYANDNAFFADVQPGNPFFTWIQIAKNVPNLIQPTLLPAGPCPTAAGNPPIAPPPAQGTTPTPGSSTLLCPNFGPTSFVTRSEMARWVVLGQMDEAQVTAYLTATGGDPRNDPRFASFADTIGDPNLRYIEVMARRGYTKGCGTTNDGLANYCPTSIITRGEMAVFLIRAKMNNVFPTTLSGIPQSSAYGDNFGLFQQSTPYFTDVPTTDAFYLYIQKMRELRITNGTGATAYGRNVPLTRAEIATFIVRAFFL